MSAEVKAREDEMDLEGGGEDASTGSVDTGGANLTAGRREYRRGFDSMI
jgi:hypothetical protein